MRGVALGARTCRWLGVALVLAAAFPAAGQAQLGGLKKLKQTVQKAAGDKPAAAAEEASPQQRSPYNEYVLELKPDVADCLDQALAAENAELDAFRTWASKVKSEDAHDACQLQVMMSAEGQALNQQLVAAMEKGGQAAMTALQTVQQKQQALVDRTCGPAQRQVEERRREVVKSAAGKGAAHCGWTERQYQVLKERLIPVCGNAALSGASGALKLPGEGRGIYWVYSAAEVEALQARCPRLQAALKKQL